MSIKILQINPNYQLLHFWSLSIRFIQVYSHKIGKRIIKRLISLIDGLEKSAHRYIEIYSVVEKTAVDIGVAMTQLIKHCIIVYA